MIIRPTDPADPAYRRLSERQARRGLAAVAAVCSAIAAGAAAINVWRGSPVPAVVWVGGLVIAFAVLWWLATWAPRRFMSPIIAALGLTSVAAVVVSDLLSPLVSPQLTVGLVGMVPIGIAVFGLWDLRDHLAWIAASSLLLAVVLLLGRNDAALDEVLLPMLLGWVTGAAFSLLAQQALERSRFAIYRSARRAHAARAVAATSLRQLQAVELIGRALSDRGPTEDTLLAAVRMLVETFEYAHPAIYLGDDQVVRLGAQLGYGGLLPSVERDTGIIGQVMRTKQPVLVEDTSADPGYRRVSADDCSEVCVPLLASGRLLGVLNVESTRPLSQDDLTTVSIVGDRIAAALDVAERRDTLERFLEASPVAIAALSPEGRMAYWNRAAAELFGWPADEVLGRATPVADADDEISIAIDREVAAGRPVSRVEAMRRHRDGHLLPVRIFAAPFGERPPYGTIVVYQDLAAERAARAALTESEARFETVVGALREGVIVQDADLNTLWANAAGERLLGITTDQLTGRSVWDDRWGVIREDGGRADHSEFPGAVAMRTGVPLLGVTLGIRHPSGEVVWVEADAVLLRRAPGEAPYAVVTSLSDVTERKRHEDELARAELQVRSVLEQAANAIVGVDEAGRITYANPRTEAVLGWAPAELIGQPVEVLVPQDLVQSHLGHRGKYARRPVSRPMGIGMELTARHRDGSSLPVEISISPVETPAGSQVFATIMDTTERRRVEAELLQAAKMESIGRLAGGIAHDFNNLLTAIIGYGEMAMADLPVDNPVRTEVAEMVRAADRASGLTRQLLGFARKSVLAPAAHDLNAIVSGLAPFLSRLLGERVALVTNLDPETGHVRVDRSQIDQILVNLAVNARDAMPDGGTLVIETHPLDALDVDDVLEVSGERVALLVVADTGLGMPEDVRARVFEPFFTTKPFGEGTGLGLATTYGIVRGSGGAITVDSEPGLGSTFRIYLPEVAPEAAGEASAPVPTTVPGSRHTILVVEDEESVRALARRLLERAGYRVLQAPNGAAAVSLVGTRLDEVDLLLSDIVMPGMRGPELYEVLQTARPDLPAVFMSGYSADGPGAAKTPGECTLLAKPFTSEALLAAVAEALGLTG